MNRILWIICLSIVALTSCKSSRQRALEFVKQGSVKEYQQDSKAAYELFTKAIATDPSLAPAWFFRGNNRLNHKDIEGAIADYSKAIELKPDYADAYANRGDAYFAEGLHDKSCPDYLKAEQLGKENMYEKTKWCR
ncbi:MAG: tetratricopeptide repeat protein [Bacteroidales bacterium]